MGNGMGFTAEARRARRGEGSESALCGMDIAERCLCNLACTSTVNLRLTMPPSAKVQRICARRSRPRL
jgi:hypothetical protein